MSRHPRAPRVHRLPQRLDWALIPAPLVLSLSPVTEKSPLPAIIVTPSSPSTDKDFSIAFLAPPSTPTWSERLATSTESLRARLSLKARTTVIVMLLLFIMACHLLSHGLAARRPHLHFAPTATGLQGSGEVEVVADQGAGWLGSFMGFWENTPMTGRDTEFVIRENS